MGSLKFEHFTIKAAVKQLDGLLDLNNFEEISDLKEIFQECKL